MKMVLVIISAIVFFVVAVGIVLIHNQANLSLYPGPMKRLTLFMTTNAANMGADPTVPELLSPNFDEAAGVIYKRAIKRAEDLGWQIVESSPQTYLFRAVVTTPMWRFKDDVDVQIVDLGQSSYIRGHSASRLGRGDLGANSYHLQLLLSGLKNEQ